MVPRTDPWIAADDAAEDAEKLAMLLDEETAGGGAAGAAGAAASGALQAPALRRAPQAQRGRRRALRARTWAKSSQRCAMT